MLRQVTPALVAGTLAFLAATALPTPAEAAGEPHYRAQLVSTPTAARLVVRDLLWRCAAGGCVSGKSNSRPAIDCAALAREAGEVRSFIAEGRALSADELEKCNRRAR